jgi:signal transduction histidine kinase
MRRRAAAIGAELSVGPGAGGRGTRVALTFDPAGGPA